MIKVRGVNNEHFIGSLDAEAGVGKTFTLNVIVAKLLNEGNKLFSAAFSGISVTLLISDSTFSIQTNAQRDSTENMVLGVDSKNLLCKKIFESYVIVLDEGSHFQKYYIEELHQFLKEIIIIVLTFGGKHMIIGSDFGKTLPILQRASQFTQFRMSIKKSFLWKKFEHYNLIVNEICRNEE